MLARLQRFITLGLIAAAAGWAAWFMHIDLPGWAVLGGRGPAVVPGVLNDRGIAVRVERSLATLGMTLVMGAHLQPPTSDRPLLQGTLSAL